MVGGTSGGGNLPVPTCSHMIASSSPIIAAGMCEGCQEVGLFVSVLASARPWRLSMSV